MERGKYYMGGKVLGLQLPTRVFPCASPAEVRAVLPKDTDVLAFQCRNPIHKAHYELFIRALEATNVGKNSVCLVHPTCGPTQVLAAGDIHERHALHNLLDLVLFVNSKPAIQAPMSAHLHMRGMYGTSAHKQVPRMPHL